jgi:dTDP-4-dehydrorhamnose reductase
MKILVIGGDGMLGAQLLRTLRPKHDVRATLRRPLGEYADPPPGYGGIDVRAADSVRHVIEEFRPDAVANAAALVSQRPEAQDEAANREVNAEFPPRLAALCSEAGAQLVHISSDAVFSGARGGYRETDAPDPKDLYGLSKLAGEVSGARAITLRTAFVGTGGSRRTGLIDWFLQRRGSVRGYRKAMFSGPTASELARAVDMLVTAHPDAWGVFHFAAAPISKYDLLCGLRDRLGLATEIVPDDSVRIDRSLDATRFCEAFSYQPPSWDSMLDELAAEIRAGDA